MANIGSKRLTRPVAAIGFTFMLVLLTANYLPVLFSAVFFIACLIFTIIAAAVKPLRSQRLLLILVTSGLAFGCFFLYTRFNYLPALKLDGEKISVSATVTDIGTSRSGKSVLTVRLDRSIVQTPIPVKANIYLDEPGDILPADRISGMVSFYLPSEEYGTSSPVQSTKADGIYLYGSAVTTGLTVTRTDGFHLSLFFHNLRNSLYEKADALFQDKDEAAIFRGMVLGDNSGINSRDYRNFVRTGILHVMVVSGFHLVLLTQSVMRTLKLLRVRRKARYLIGMAAVLFLMAVTGFTPSINRAGIMLLLCYSAKLFDRESDSLTTIGLTGLLMTLFSPFLVTDLSFQLTYLSTLGIILLSRRMADAAAHRLKCQNKLLLWVLDMGCVTLSALLFTLPVTAFYFKGISLLSLIFNLILSPVFTLILVLGLCASIFAFLPFLSVAAQVLSAVLSVLIEGVSWLVDAGAKIPYSYLPLGYRFVYFWILASILLLVFVAVKCSFRHRYPIALLLSLLTLGGAVLTHMLANRDILTVASCTQGEDTAVVFAYRDKMLILDCNSLALQLTEETMLHKIPFVLTGENLAELAEYADYCQIDTVCTDSIVPDGTISCRQVCEPSDAEFSFTMPLRMRMKVRDGNVYCAVSYGNVNLIYGSYDDTLESMYEECKENIYILVKDCNSVFEKPVKYVIMLSSAQTKIKQNNPGVTFIDGSRQGITPVRVRPNGSIKSKGAGQWLY